MNDEKKRLLVYCIVVAIISFILGMQYGTFKGMDYCVNIGLQLFERAGYNIDIASGYLAAGILKYRGIVEKFTNLTPEQLESWGGR